NLFRDLAGLQCDAPDDAEILRERFADRAAFTAWADDYRARLRAEQSDDAARRAAMCAVNPRYVLRNYLAQQAIERAERGDYGEVERLLALLSRPFEEQPGLESYAAPPPAWARGLAIGCSS
ncbi:MAG: YdiU family protein, partial [Gammaproteobacteria bacterium]|nr:YdiU family protein [Gammaproteobacteria bacterium]